MSSSLSRRRPLSSSEQNCSSNYRSTTSSSRTMSSQQDDPPNSRLFIVCSRSLTEDDFRAAFEPFGQVEEAWIVKNRTTNESKGIAYVKFSKTSEAALALEEMNGKCISNCPRPLKVMIANAKEQGNRRESNEEERLLRLFVLIPKDMTESELRDNFGHYGDLDYVSIVRDRTTKESKGLAYVKYHRVSHAARAFEECDKSFKAVFAEPKPTNNPRGSTSNYGYGGVDHHRSSSHHQGHVFDVLSYMDPSQSNPDHICTLSVTVTSSHVNQDQMWRLFDIVPGLDYCQASGPTANGHGFVVVYNNAQSASYAREKMHALEYPPGHRLIVRFDASIGPSHYEGFGDKSRGYYRGGGGGPDADMEREDTYDPSYCSVRLPSIKPMLATDSEVAERLFIVCSPMPPQMFILKDVFGRFGNLIDIYMLNGKSCGYAKYASKQSALNAINTLHGQEVAGARLKVMVAEPLNHDKAAKRQRLAGKEVNIGDD